MTHSTKKGGIVPTTPANSSSVTAMLGPPSILSNESLAEYYALEAEVAVAIDGETVLEKFVIRNVTDLYWEMGRFKKAITRIIDSSYKRAVDSLMKALGHSKDDGGNFSDNYFEDDEARQTVLDILETHGLDEEAITAEAIRLSMNEIEPLNKLVERTEYRIYAVLREHDRRTNMKKGRLGFADGPIIEGVAVNRTKKNENTTLPKPEDSADD